MAASFRPQARRLFLALVLALSLWGAEAIPQLWHEERPSVDDEITAVPGFKGLLPSRHFAGYIDVNAKGRNLFYYLVHSEGDPASDPLVVWLNGGPGCSSFDGWTYEHGPFTFGRNKEGHGKPAQLNPYSWSKSATMLYIDSPSGVGFSFSEDPADYDVDDTRTAEDLYQFLLKLLERHPELASREVYIAGESYAGVYVPMFAARVMKGNSGDAERVINLRGYMVGNGVTDPVFDGNALVPFAAGKSLIDEALHKELKQACGTSFWNATQGSPCDVALGKMDDVLKNLNIYDSLDTCYHGGAAPGGEPTERRGSALDGMPMRGRSVGRAWPLRANVRMGQVKTWPQLLGGLAEAPPCIDDSLARSYLNRADVQKAFHVKAGTVWKLCTERITYTHDVASMIDIHRSLLSQGLAVLIYSGDHDMCVPHTGSEAWTASLELPVVDAWRPWLFDDGQVAGYVKVYQGLHTAKMTYATVLGAGHTVPQYKPKQSLQMLTAFLKGIPL